MKISLKVSPSFLVAVVVTLTVSLPSACRSGPTNSFGIYLAAEPVDRRILSSGMGDWSHLKLEAVPVISDADILAYNFTNHWMTLRPETFKRLPRPSIPGTAFIVVVNGERIYLGALTTIESSIPVVVPSIISEGSDWYTNLPPGTLQIDRAYPRPGKLTGPDPRSDERIKRALSALHKLK